MSKKTDRNFKQWYYIFISVCFAIITGYITATMGNPSDMLFHSLTVYFLSLCSVALAEIENILYENSKR